MPCEKLASQSHLTSCDFAEVSSVAQGHTSADGGNDLEAMVDYINEHLDNYVYVWAVTQDRNPTKFNFPMLRPRQGFVTCSPVMSNS